MKVIDLLRTRGSFDPHTAGCAQLLAAVIADAIECASAPLHDDEKQFEENRNFESADAARSIWFLFDDNSPFRLYAKLIGLHVESVREALLDPNKKYAPKSGFNDSKARIVRIRHQWYVQLRDTVSNYESLMLRVNEKEPREQKGKKVDNKTYVRARDVFQHAEQQATD